MSEKSKSTKQSDAEKEESLKRAKEFTEMILGSGSNVSRDEFNLYKTAANKTFEDLLGEVQSLNKMSFTTIEIKNGPLDMAISTSTESLSTIMDRIQEFFQFMSEEYGYSVSTDNNAENDPNIA